MSEDILVPLAFFAIIPVSIWAVSAYRAKSHKATIGLLETMANKGEPITPDLVKTLGVRRKPKHADLRTGLILIAITLGLFIFAGVIPDDEAPTIITALAAFPGLIGAVFVGLWFFLTRKDET